MPERLRRAPVIVTMTEANFLIGRKLPFAGIAWRDRSATSPDTMIAFEA